MVDAAPDRAHIQWCAPEHGRRVLGHRGHPYDTAVAAAAACGWRGGQWGGRDGGLVDRGALKAKAKDCETKDDCIGL